MKIIKSILLISLLFFLQDCSDNITGWYETSTKPVILSDTGIGTLQSDSISIQKVEINGDNIIIYCTYLGGCGTHSLNLYSETGFLESSPVQLRMRLIHKADSETCDKVIHVIAKFDLRQVAGKYKSAYRTDKGIIMLSIYDSDLTKQLLPQPKYVFEN